MTASADLLADAPRVDRTWRVIRVALVLGAACVVGMLAAEPGSPVFYGLAVTAPVVWVGASARARRASGARPPAGRGPVAAATVGLLLGAATFVGFLGLYLVVREWPLVGAGIDSILATARAGPMPVIVTIAIWNGIGEEVFFRGTVYSAFEDRAPARRSTLVYASVTALTLNPALTAASVVMGAMFAGLRRWSGGIVAPVVAHALWSALMVVVVGGLH
mgnify:CR=1 FL=1